MLHRPLHAELLAVRNWLNKRLSFGWGCGGFVTKHSILVVHVQGLQLLVDVKI